MCYIRSLTIVVTILPPRFTSLIPNAPCTTRHEDPPYPPLRQSRMCTNVTGPKMKIPRSQPRLHRHIPQSQDPRQHHKALYPLANNCFANGYQCPHASDTVIPHPTSLLTSLSSLKARATAPGYLS